jgi:hypothetical protein
LIIPIPGGDYPALISGLPRSGYDRTESTKARFLAPSGKVREGTEVLEAFHPTNSQYARAMNTASKIDSMRPNENAYGVRCFNHLGKSQPNKMHFVPFRDALEKGNGLGESVESSHSNYRVFR